MRIAVVGSGYVGLVAGACFADLGHDVILVDNDDAKLAALKDGQVPIHEKFLPELLNRHRGHRLEFSADLQEAVRASAAIVVAVGTPPTDRGDADLSYVEMVAREISGAINGYKVVVEKSTVPVYTSEWIRKIILRNGADPDSFDVASNPEFLREGTAVTDFLFPDRILVGCNNDRCAAVLREVYTPLTSGTYYKQPDAIPQPDRTSIPAPIIVTSTQSAEMIKHASNAFLAMKISFINAVASICETVGADVNQVTHGIGSDSRIGPRFLNPGIGYGGSCFPKDVSALKQLAGNSGYHFQLLTAVIEVNELQKRRVISKLQKHLGSLVGRRVALLGLAFKANTDDMREASSLVLAARLQADGATVTAYDPIAEHEARKRMRGVQFADSALGAVEGADAAILVTEWPEFSELDWREVKSRMAGDLLIDGRNFTDRDEVTAAGFTYEGIGR